MPEIQSDHLPEVHLGFRQRFVDVAAGQDALACAVAAWRRMTGVVGVHE
jgi:hypothetical protein